MRKPAQPKPRTYLPVAEAFARAAEAARRYAICGKLLRQDLPALYACTARDSGRPVAEVIAELEGGA